MANNIIVFAKNKAGISPVVELLLNEIGGLLNIKGYYLEYKQRACHYYSLNPCKHMMAFPEEQIIFTGEEVLAAEQKLIPHLSLFPNPDLVLLDGIGNIECQSQRFCRQMNVLFESRVPVIIILENEQQAAFVKLKDMAPFLYETLSGENQSEIYMRLLKLLD